MSPVTTTTTTAVRPLSPAALCLALVNANVTLTASRDGLAASPRSEVTTDIAESIRAHKPSLRRALFGQGPITPFPCAFCGLDFVSIAFTNCPTCEQLLDRPMRFSANSTEERSFLVDLEKRSTSPEEL
jgi:hypothetical protein